MIAQRTFPGIICAIVFVCWSSQSFAWRETGHFTICEIATNHLTPTALEKLKQIFNDRDFARQCTWPDMVRKSEAWKHSYPWHFINIDDGKLYFSKSALNQGGDLLQALVRIESAFQYDEFSKMSNEQKAIVFRFLGHLIGDLHQPLHVGRTWDSGGNRIYVSWFGEKKYRALEYVRANPNDINIESCTSNSARTMLNEQTEECLIVVDKLKSLNLHKVWDLSLIHTYAIRNFSLDPDDHPDVYLTYTYNLEKTITAKNEKRWINSFFYDWIQESRNLRIQAYDIPESKNLEESYYNDNIKIVNQRLAQAGIRLAHTLNRYLDPSYATAYTVETQDIFETLLTRLEKYLISLPEIFL